MTKKILPLSALCLLLAILFTLPACGVKGDPKPRQSSRSFVWQEVTITSAGACLDVNAVMSGVYTNLSAVMLELSEVNGPQDCPGCPFLPSETYTVDNFDRLFNRQNGTLRFSYCPRTPTAMSYRARLIGANVFDSSRHAVSPEQTVAMPLSDIIQK
ncbi:MAG: hypothetical protein LBV80_02505 [Deltaproteobacteria bacterium]|nr:hypothetical protein [Deltaproteobacteria bacterium]